MRENVNFRKIEHPRYTYLVSYSQGRDEQNKAVRRKTYFESRQAAQEFAAKKRTELTNEGNRAGEITDAERRAVLKFREAAREMTGLPDVPTLERAVEFYARHLRSSTKRATVRQIVSELLITKERAGRSGRHLDNLRVRLARFSSSFGDRDAREISPEEINDWLYSLRLSPTSLDNFRRVLLNLFNFAVKRRFRDDNPVTLTEKPKLAATPPGILTPGEMRRLFAAAQVKAPSLLPMIAIGGFAGLRAAEITRLDWKELRLDAGVVEVTADKSKTASRRLVTISANLAAWLQLHTPRAGPVMPPNARKLFDAVRAIAGLLENWPDNGLRHSFASYHLARGQDAAKTAFELGHTSAAIVHRHYKELVLAADASQWWSIMPKEKKARKGKVPPNVVPMVRASA